MKQKGYQRLSARSKDPRPSVGRFLIRADAGCCHGKSTASISPWLNGRRSSICLG